jgi:transglutaminase-like putative cysteine protease
VLRIAWQKRKSGLPVVTEDKSMLNQLEEMSQTQIISPAMDAVGSRRLRVRHCTQYHYEHPIFRSTHELHLRPIDDWKQKVISYRLQISPPVKVIEYEDVFGNWAQRFDLNQQYQDLTIVAESQVEVLDVDPFAFAKLPTRAMFPLVWMPWERTMLAPYLSPQELPVTQLREIYDYAMSFVERNRSDLMETLFAINLTLFREYKYLKGSTSLDTTAYEVLTRRAGVCQDFANLFICMARLLGIPARYVCGYIDAGATSIASRASCEATHAWVQLYLPHIGWKGFDPTNGVLPQTNHVRVSYGRHYRDTAPTSGTIYCPARETMNVQVQVNPID